MGQTLAERIQYEAAYDRNFIFAAYAGDLADLMSELTTRAERAESALAERDKQPPDRDFTTTGDFRRARGVIPWQPGNEPAETTIRRLRDAPERAERAEAALAAVPWQALLNISHALEASDAARDPDEAALLAFLNQYAPWVPNESEE